MARCKANLVRRMNQKGGTKTERCKASALRGSSYCLFHNKGKSVNYMKSRKMRSDQARRK